MMRFYANRKKEREKSKNQSVFSLSLFSPQNQQSFCFKMTQPQKASREINSQCKHNFACLHLNREKERVKGWPMGELMILPSARFVFAFVCWCFCCTELNLYQYLASFGAFNAILWAQFFPSSLGVFFSLALVVICVCVFSRVCLFSSLPIFSISISAPIQLLLSLRWLNLSIASTFSCVKIFFALGAS